MIVLRDLPSDDELRSMAQRYPDLQPELMASLLTFMRTAFEIVHASEALFARHGTSCGRFTVLALLNRDPERTRTPSEIAEACGVTRATITGLLDGIEADGLISRVRSSSDRRTMHVRLTAQGRRFLDKMLPEHFQRLARLMSGVGASDQASLRRIAATIGGNISTFSTDPSPRSR